MQGLHLMADLFGCQCRADLMLSPATLSEQARARVSAAGLTVVGETWHTFPATHQKGGGFTGVLLLAESHVAIHTWPERDNVTLDVYVCNFSQDNTVQAEQLLQDLIGIFAPKRQLIHRLQRGDNGDRP